MLERESSFRHCNAAFAPGSTAFLPQESLIPCQLCYPGGGAIYRSCHVCWQDFRDTCGIFQKWQINVTILLPFLLTVFNRWDPTSKFSFLGILWIQSMVSYTSLEVVGLAFLPCLWCHYKWVQSPTQVGFLMDLLGKLERWKIWRWWDGWKHRWK